MGCDDVCIDMDYDEDNEFYSSSMRRARKPHQCGECRRTICAGEQYEKVAGKTDGSMWDAKTCAECLEIRKSLVCGSWVFGQLWDEIEQAVFPQWQKFSPIDCLAKIDSLAARDQLRDRYREWQREG